MHRGKFNQHFRALKLSAVSLAALATALPAGAAQAAQAAAASDAVVDEIVVTGSRIVRDGFEAPTPVSVIGVEQIQNAGTPNIADFVNQMPAVAGSATPGTSRKSSSSGQAGLNVLNLRSLGAGRTLVLLDGQRSVGSNVSGSVDINNFPQDLVSRVEVVTGGASAAYGSDALSGVVNFILDKEYTGVKGQVSAGMTTYGDNKNWGGTLTAGTPFAAGRGHFLFSGEVSMVPGVDYNYRDWAQKGWKLIFNPAYGTGAGQSTSVPQLITRDKVGMSQATLGGIITNTALAGIEFGPGGVPRVHNMGSLISNPFHVGGDWESSNIDEYGSLEGGVDRQSVFSRVSYDVADNVTIFAQATWGHNLAINYNARQYDVNNKVIFSGNPFIPASVQTQMTALGITQFTMGTMNADLWRIGHINDRILNRYVVGADGTFDAAGTEWGWNVYYQTGASRLSENLETSSRSRYNAAIDAVRHPTTGAIVCRINLSIPNHPCVPYNIMGIGVNSEGALNYVQARAYRYQKFTQDVMAATFTGEPFSLWAGPVSIAFGAEHRKEAVTGISSADDQALDLFVGNFLPNVGSYSVTEGFVETVVPLAAGESWAQALDLNAAVRATDYSTSGYVTTWKVGITYAPIDDIRFRVTRSRDIRAPNLGELYQAGSTTVSFLNDPFNNNARTQAYNTISGNLNLDPEKADGLGIGAVLSPTFLPGFQASVDYYKINVNGGIGSVGEQAVLDLCHQGVQQYCNAITREIVAGAPILRLLRQPFNFSGQRSKGIDFEASYTTPLSAIFEPADGTLTARALATRFIENYSFSGVPTDIPSDSVGGNGGNGPPKWRYNFSLNYGAETFNVNLTARGISSGVRNTSWVECQTGCPVSTANNRTIDSNHMPGAMYFDVSGSYKFLQTDAVEMEAFLNIRNVANKDPAMYPAGWTGTDFNNPPYNPSMYDYLGRVFRGGIRFTM
jgi:outer membrane receptor protein involved in Fe transport